MFPTELMQGPYILYAEGAGPSQVHARQVTGYEAAMHAMSSDG